MDFLAGLKKQILNFIFPVRCLGCNLQGTYCCDKCALSLSGNFHSTGNIFASAQFERDSLLTKLIHAFKYDFAEEISHTLVEIFPKRPPKIFESDAVLVPVPLHKRRFNFRGFNQSRLLADLIAKKWNVKVGDILIRHKFTRPQVELAMHERKTNVLGAFSMKNPKESLYPNIKYFIVDDVFTTGATMNECAKVLRGSGAKFVYGLVIARTAPGNV